MVRENIFRAMALVLALLMVLLLCACKNTNYEEVPTYEDAGYYTLVSVAGDGLSLAGDALTEAGYDGYYIEMNEDGTGEMFLDGEVQAITWQDDLITLENGDEFRYRYETGSIVHTDPDTGNIWRYVEPVGVQEIVFTDEDGNPIENSSLQIVSIQVSSETSDDMDTTDDTSGEVAEEEDLIEEE